mgnify:CR=1 FL=1
MTETLRRTNGRRGFAAALALALVLLWGLWPAMAGAQSIPRANGVVVDDTGTVDVARVNEAARQLESLGVKPLAIVLRSANGRSAIDVARAAAAQEGLVPNGALDADLFAVAVLVNERQSAIVYGDRLKAAMEQRAGGGTVADDLRLARTNRLSAGWLRGTASSNAPRTAGSRTPAPSPRPWLTSGTTPLRLYTWRTTALRWARSMTRLRFLTAIISTRASGPEWLRRPAMPTGSRFRFSCRR